MSNIIIAIIAYVGWTILKNIFKEMNSPGSVTGKMPTPPVVNTPMRTSPMPQYRPVTSPQPSQTVEVPQTPVSGSMPYDNVDYDPQPAKKPTKTQKVPSEIPLNNKKIPQEIKKEEPNSLVFDNNSVLNGIIMSEILGKPRARKNII